MPSQPSARYCSCHFTMPATHLINSPSPSHPHRQAQHRQSGSRWWMLCPSLAGRLTNWTPSWRHCHASCSCNSFAASRCWNAAMRLRWAGQGHRRAGAAGVQEGPVSFAARSYPAGHRPERGASKRAVDHFRKFNSHYSRGFENGLLNLLPHLSSALCLFYRGCMCRLYLKTLVACSCWIWFWAMRTVCPALTWAGGATLTTSCMGQEVGFCLGQPAHGAHGTLQPCTQHVSRAITLGVTCGFCFLLQARSMLAGRWPLTHVFSAVHLPPA